MMRTIFGRRCIFVIFSFACLSVCLPLMLFSTFLSSLCRLQPTLLVGQGPLKTCCEKKTYIYASASARVLIMIVVKCEFNSDLNITVKHNAYLCNNYCRDQSQNEPFFAFCTYVSYLHISSRIHISDCFLYNRTSDSI